MYSIYIDDQCVYDKIDLYNGKAKAANPKLSMADNSAGSLTFTIHLDNIGYYDIKRMLSEITVFRETHLFGGEKTEIWSGRIINEVEDFYGNKTFTCEGELAYLNDTIQLPAEYHNISVRDFLSKLIEQHNSRVGGNKKFEVGTVTVTDSNDSLYRYTNYETTWECINDKLLDRLGGHLRIRKDGKKRVLDYLADYVDIPESLNYIKFGDNLLDFTKNWDLTKLATVIIPRGARLNESPIEALEAYLTVASVNDGSIYIESLTAIESYGRVEKVVDWEDVTDPQNLFDKGKQYLKEAQFNEMILEISAIDLTYIMPNKYVIPLKVLDNVLCISEKHGLNARFPVSKIDIPLDSPEDAVYTLGRIEKGSPTTFGVSHFINQVFSHVKNGFPVIKK